MDINIIPNYVAAVLVPDAVTRVSNWWKAKKGVKALLKLRENLTGISTVKEYVLLGDSTSGVLGAGDRRLESKRDRIVGIAKMRADLHGGFLHNISVSYRLSDGEEYNYSIDEEDYTEERTPGDTEEINFRSGEYITCVRGCTALSLRGEKYVASIEITTNYGLYGPIGNPNDDQSNAFEHKAVGGGEIIAILGRSSPIGVHDIRVYVKEFHDKKQISPTVIKYGPRGNNIKSVSKRGIDATTVEKIDRIVKISVFYGDVVNAITTVFKSDGKKTRSQIGTGIRGAKQVINLSPDEYIMLVRGYIGFYQETPCVRSIEMLTNYTEYGPYGLCGYEDDGFIPFEFKAYGGHIIGFHGCFGKFIDAIGVYVKKGETRSQPEKENLRQQLEEETRLRHQAEEDYCRVLNENKALKERIIEWECNSYQMFKFTWFQESELPTFDHLIGEGSYGNVYETKINGITVAIKEPKIKFRGGREFNQEVDILSRIRHPNIVILIGACPKQYALVYEYLPNGSLSDRLFETKDKKALSWKERIKIAADICSALIFLHNMKPNPIAHGDLKPNNILFDSNNICKLIDFGHSRFLKYTDNTMTPNHKTNVPIGTDWYEDPEHITDNKLTPHSDVYSYGIILLQLVTGKFATNLRNNLLEKIRSLEFFEDQNQSQQKKLLQEFTEADLVGPINEVVKMICFGIRCSETESNKRPDLKVVWNEIVNGFGYHDN